MKILILSYFFPPATMGYSQRVGKLAKYFSQYDKLDILVFCGNDGQNLSQKDWSFRQEIPKSVEVKLIPSFYEKICSRDTLPKILVYYLYKIFSHPDVHMEWALRIYYYGKKYFSKFQKPDVIISSGPPNSCYIGALFLSHALKIPFIMDMRDPWWRKFEHNSVYELTYKLFYSKIEKLLFNKANKVILNTNINYKNKIALHPLIKEKFIVIPNGFDSEDFALKKRTLANYKNKNNTINLLYLGGIRGQKQNIVFEHEFFSICQKLYRLQPEFQAKLYLHFVGAEKNVLYPYLKKYELAQNSYLYDFIPSKEIGALVEEADGHILIVSDKNEDGWIPSKVYYYIASKKPIFVFSQNRDTEILFDWLKYPAYYSSSFSSYDTYLNFKNFVNFVNIFSVDNYNISQKKINQLTRKHIASKFYSLLSDLVCNEI